MVFWIHGGGWQAGDKTDVQLKPQAFVDKGFVFVSTNYRLLPSVDMGTIVRDVAKSIRWVHDHIAEYGGDPEPPPRHGPFRRAQLAALICTDDRYLKAEGLSLAIIKGCVPVDGDTYDVPAIIETAETRRRVHGLPQAKFGHREKFGNDPAKHRDFSAVTHVAEGKGIPPFLILHVAEHPDTTAQAQRLAAVLKDAGVPVTVFGARETNHTKINADLGLARRRAEPALFAFVRTAAEAGRGVALIAGQTISWMTFPSTNVSRSLRPRCGIGQLVLIEAELVQDRGVDVAEVIGALDGVQADGVGGADDLPALDAAAGHPHREAEVVVVAALARLGLGRAAELAAPEDQRRCRAGPGASGP